MSWATIIAWALIVPSQAEGDTKDLPDPPAEMQALEEDMANAREKTGGTTQTSAESSVPSEEASEASPPSSEAEPKGTRVRPTSRKPAYRSLKDNDAESTPIVRSGLTLEASLGFGILQRGETLMGGSSLAGSLGVSLTQEITLLLRAHVFSSRGVYANNSNWGDVDTMAALMIGPAVQYWLSNRLFVGAGVGAAAFLRSYTEERVDIFEPESWESQNENNETHLNRHGGVGVSLRGGYSLFNKGDNLNVIRIGIEVTPIVYRDASSLSVVACAEIQYF